MVAVGAGLVIVWYMSDHAAVPPVVLPAQAAIPQPAGNDSLLVTHPAVPTNITAQPPSSRGWTNPVQNVDPRPWEQILDSILTGAGEASEKADMLTNLMTLAPVEAEVELAQHLVNLAEDDHYDGAAAFLTNATTPAAVATVLLNDLLNRKNTLKLPMLLVIARNQDHPLKDQAKDMLELFLQADYSTNWDQWASAVDTWLQENQ